MSSNARGCPPWAAPFSLLTSQPILVDYVVLAYNRDLEHFDGGYKVSPQAGSQQRHNHLIFGETAMASSEVVLFGRPPQVGLPVADRD